MQQNQRSNSTLSEVFNFQTCGLQPQPMLTQVTSHEAIYQILRSSLWSHKRLYTTCHHLTPKKKGENSFWRPNSVHKNLLMTFCCCLKYLCSHTYCKWSEHTGAEHFPIKAESSNYKKFSSWTANCKTARRLMFSFYVFLGWLFYHQNHCHTTHIVPKKCRYCSLPLDDLYRMNRETAVPF